MCKTAATNRVSKPVNPFIHKSCRRWHQRRQLFSWGICPPGSHIGPVTPADREQLIKASLIYGHYENSIDRESAYEILKGRAAEAPAPEEVEKDSGFDWGGLFGGGGSDNKTSKPAGRKSQSMFEAAAKSAARVIGSELGRQIARGVLGSILGGNKRGK